MSGLLRRSLASVFAWEAMHGTYFSSTGCLNFPLTPQTAGSTRSWPLSGLLRSVDDVTHF